MSAVEKAIEIALEAHQGQVDKAGKPYILHPRRLMLQMDDELEMIAALLHDVVEDSNLDLDELRKRGIPDDAVDAVGCLTKRVGESYEEFIERAGNNPIARKVKIADLEDNMNMARLPEIRPKDLDRLAKYHRSLRELKTD